MGEPVEQEWKEVEHTCPDCGGVNVLHEQLPEWLEGDGVRWECRHCGRVHLIPGTGRVTPLTEALECGECHRTFDNVAHGDGEAALIEVAGDGTWSCPGCDTVNRLVAGSETATAADTGGTS